jgi:hypothetical protein
MSFCRTCSVYSTLYVTLELEHNAVDVCCLWSLDASFSEEYWLQTCRIFVSLILRTAYGAFPLVLRFTFVNGREFTVWGDVPLTRSLSRAKANVGLHVKSLLLLPCINKNLCILTYCSETPLIKCCESRLNSATIELWRMDRRNETNKRIFKIFSFEST